MKFLLRVKIDICSRSIIVRKNSPTSRPRCGSQQSSATTQLDLSINYLSTASAVEKLQIKITQSLLLFLLRKRSPASLLPHHLHTEFCNFCHAQWTLCGYSTTSTNQAHHYWMQCYKAPDAHQRRSFGVFVEGDKGMEGRCPVMWRRKWLTRPLQYHPFRLLTSERLAGKMGMSSSAAYEYLEVTYDSS
jgi:hypothetical protein